MKKSELKEIIKDCVKEVLFEEGVLSGIIAEVAFGITKAQNILSETKNNEKEIKQKIAPPTEELKHQKLLETKRKMLNAIGNNSMKNVFEGTTPLASAGSESPHSPLANLPSNDAGVDISGIFNSSGNHWKKLSKG